jgi:hypothetical protein
MNRYSLTFTAIGLFLMILSGTLMAQGTVMQGSTEKNGYVKMPIPIAFTIKNAEDWSPPTMPDVDGLEIKRDEGSQSFSSFQVNGSKISQNSETVYTFLITAERPGIYVIPAFPIEVDGRTLSTHPITVSFEKVDNQGLLTAEISSKSDRLYLGETIELTMNILVREFESTAYDTKVDSQTMWQLITDSQWGPFTKSVQEIQASRRPLRGQTRTLLDENGDRQSYFLYTLKTDVRPRSTGPYNLSEIVVRMKYPASLRRGRGFFATSRIEIDQFKPIEAVASGKEILVLPLPEKGKPEDFSGAVGVFDIKTTASPTKVSVGDPVTLTMTITNTSSDQTDMDVVPAPPLHKIRLLEDDFRVPRETLAGVASGRSKIFTQTIRAKRDSIESIPPITYSYFDPETGDYETAESRAIPIQVSPSETINSADITGATNQNGDFNTDNLHAVTGGLLANYTGEDRLLTDQGPPGQWWLLLLLLAPPVVSLGTIVTLRGIRSHTSDTDRIRSRKAARMAMQRLQDSGKPDDARVAQAICFYVADKTGHPSAGFLRGDVYGTLVSIGIEKSLVKAIDRLLSDCEQLHYSGRSNSSESSLAGTARQLIEELEASAAMRGINMRGRK